MKISNSKKELARIISENGGWRDGEFSVMRNDGTVLNSSNKPFYEVKYGWCCGGGFGDSRFESAIVAKNWHQTILSREEYFFLHQDQGLEDALDEPTVEAKPTIEQLAADYRNLLDFARRKQQEADDAKDDAEAKLAELVAAGKVLGLLVSPITAKQEPELVITVQAGDEVECVESNINRDKYNGMAGTVLEVDDSSTPYLVDFGGSAKIWCYKVKFIRRP